MHKLWQKNELTEDANIFCKFTTGNDYQLDHSYFLEHDLRATSAWAEALGRAGIYTDEELKRVLTALENIRIKYIRGSFGVSSQDEDCHTAIEHALVNEVGEIGKKIHTGRSRNDQSLTMIRLFMQERLGVIENKTRGLSNRLLGCAVDSGEQLFIGYSHTQQAMPTTVEHYYMSHAESLFDDMALIKNISDHISQCPLGTGSGFGSQLDIDRDFLTARLGLRITQNNSLYCQNSRGKFELLYINALSQVMLTIQRLASDMILYTSREFGLFTMSESLSQGSSMMPQKKNPDVFELVRAKSCDVMALEERVKMIIKGLPSGYSRDLQEIKACIVDAYNITANCIDIMTLAMSQMHIEPDPEKIASRIESDITQTDSILIKCTTDSNLKFRDIYKDENTQDLDPLQAALSRKSKGSPGRYYNSFQQQSF
jgi:argininosuccinate lyase